MESIEVLNSSDAIVLSINDVRLIAGNYIWGGGNDYLLIHSYHALDATAINNEIGNEIKIKIDGVVKFQGNLASIELISSWKYPPENSGIKIGIPI